MDRPGKRKIFQVRLQKFFSSRKKFRSNLYLNSCAARAVTTARESTGHIFLRNNNGQLQALPISTLLASPPPRLDIQSSNPGVSLSTRNALLQDTFCSSTPVPQLQTGQEPHRRQGFPSQIFTSTQRPLASRAPPAVVSQPRRTTLLDDNQNLAAPSVEDEIQPTTDAQGKFARSIQRIYSKLQIELKFHICLFS